MIAANELRIGNKILCDGKMATVANLFPDNIRVKEKSIYEQASHESMYEPIPLTPEILEKAGFVPEIWPNQTSSLFYYPNFQCNEKYLFHGSNTLQILGKNLEGAFWIMDCQFVHQLQNLYFALTGTELEINL